MFTSTYLPLEDRCEALRPEHLRTSASLRSALIPHAVHGASTPTELQSVRNAQNHSDSLRPFGQPRPRQTDLRKISRAEKVAALPSIAPLRPSGHGWQTARSRACNTAVGGSAQCWPVNSSLVQEKEPEFERSGAREGNESLLGDACHNRAILRSVTAVEKMDVLLNKI